MTVLCPVCAVLAALTFPCVSLAGEDDLNRGFSALKDKDYDQAIAYFTAALRADPKNARAFLGRGAAYFTMEDYDRAIKGYTEALRLNPQSPKNDVYHQKAAEAYYQRGINSQGKKDYGLAIKDYQEAVRWLPDYVRPNNNLAWLLATCPKCEVRDGKKAVEHAIKACELTKWKNPRTLGTLAAAYAEDGQFEASVKWQKKALETPGLTDREINDDRERLKGYEQGKPARIN
jgi:tetratricopeptide (TPR) repeat protein